MQAAGAGSAPVCSQGLLSTSGLRDHDCRPTEVTVHCSSDGLSRRGEGTPAWFFLPIGPHSPLGRSLAMEHPSQDGQPLGDRPRRRQPRSPLGLPLQVAQPGAPDTEATAAARAPPMIRDFMEVGRTGSGVVQATQRGHAARHF